MRRRPSPARASAWIACAALLLLAACGTTTATTSTVKLSPTSSLKPDKPIATPGLAPGERLNTAIAFLGQGQPEHARVELMQLLDDDPGNGIGRGLLRQIETDPKTLLGDQNFSYRMKRGESLSILADRFLGDPLLFYALARYNHIFAADATTAGQVLLIPGVPKKPGSARARAAKAALLTRR
jgi:nucleoid-associated protein YgaU